jgi:hypothetical protein
MREMERQEDAGGGAKPLNTLILLSAHTEETENSLTHGDLACDF